MGSHRIAFAPAAPPAGTSPTRVSAPALQSTHGRGLRLLGGQYVLFHGKRHPRELGAKELEAYLNHLAGERRVAASTQSQALNALVFLYRQVLELDLGWMACMRDASKSSQYRD